MSKKFLYVWTLLFSILLSSLPTLHVACFAGSAPNAKPYTIMVYMNGSDLESESGAATDDLIEMLESGLDSRNANIVILTGGTRRWQNNVVPSSQCVIWEAADGLLYESKRLGLVNMGDPNTLTDFIVYAKRNYPANQYGLVLWDHGGGSITGYGRDERFADSSLTLMDMSVAFERAGLHKQKLSFLGFDSCLMATVEMAVVASPFAHVLIASEDLEPGDGWDYRFLSVLNRNPRMDGKSVGVAVVDSFMKYYGPNSDEILSLSVVDLTLVKPVMDAMGTLMKKCSEKLTNPSDSFRTLARKRHGTKTFGEGSPHDNDCDMVDAGDMAIQLSDLFPKESSSLLTALKQAVVYNRHNSDTSLWGLSAYYIYGGKDYGDYALDTYATLRMSNEYTLYLNHFYKMLLGWPTAQRRVTRSAMADQNPTVMLSDSDVVQRDQTLWKPVARQRDRYRMIGTVNHDSPYRHALAASGKPSEIMWPQINNIPVCLTEINRTANTVLCAVPAVINGMDGDIIVQFNGRYPDGKIIGSRKEENAVIQKGYDDIEPGDTISFYYQEKLFGDRDDGILHWVTDHEITVDDHLRLSWEPAAGKLYTAQQLTDYRLETYFTELQPLY